MNVTAFLRMGLCGTLVCATLLIAAHSPAVSASITQRDRYASFVIDARTGNVLNQANADDLRHPASLTKMMTLYLLFEAMRDGRMTLSTPIRFSAEAASRPPTKLGVPVGGSISAESAILGLITRSANDVAAAVGEALAGDEDAFARVMTQRARSLGMSRTTFRNASGLPDPEQVTTARDMVTLGRRLIQDFPERYHYFSTTHFAHGNRLIRNHNGMLRDYPGADGIKTGYINASGFNIVTSAQRDGVRLVGAVLGGASWVQRNEHMADLFDEGFARLGVRSVPAMPPGGVERVVAARDAPAGTGLRRPAIVPVVHTTSRHVASAAARPAVAASARQASLRAASPVVTPVTARTPARANVTAASRPASAAPVSTAPAAPRATARQRPAAPRTRTAATPQPQVAAQAGTRTLMPADAPMAPRQVMARASGG